MKRKEALALLRKHGVGEGIVRHVEKVRDYALEIAAQHPEADEELVEAGALLHDIGRARTHGLDHAVVGAAILRGEGVDERIVRIAERHVGAGLTRAEAADLGLPPGDYLPETIEEKIVCHADNLIGNDQRITIHEAIRTAKERWTPGALGRLVAMHCEVFRPETVRLSRGACSMATMDEVLGKMDVLFKCCQEGEGGGCTVSVYGHDAKKAAARLRKLGTG